MKKRFIAGTVGIALLALLISAAASVYTLSARESAAARRSLRELLCLVETQLAQRGAAETVSAFSAAAPDKRLTIIGQDGAVLADSGQESAENHGGRPEVREALSSGWGESARHSATLGQPMLYVAKRFAGGAVGRAAMPLSTIDSMVRESLPLLTAAMLLALLLSFLLARRLAGTLARPLDEVRQALQDVLSGERAADLAAYEPEEELQPVFRLIARLVDQLGQDLRQIRAERDKAALVLDCMGEGLILLAEDGAILAVNRAARELFSLSGGNDGGARLLLRSKAVREALETVHLTHTAQVLDQPDPGGSGRELRFFLSPAGARRYEGRTVGASILISDVTELKKAERARSEFTANVSHELKTPLTSIKGVTELLSQGLVRDEADRAHFYTMIGVETDRLISLIDDILDLSELESGRRDAAEPDASPLNEAREAAGLVQGEAERRGVSITVAGEEGEAHIPPARLRELFLNLLSNAVRYSRDGGGHADVSVRRDGGQFVISVADDGTGIPEEAQAHVFERFYRADKGRSRASGGTGLGLAIVKHICQLYGGSVTLESAPGVGSTFTVRLPAAP